MVGIFTYASLGGTLTHSVVYTYDVFDRRIEKAIDSDGNNGLDKIERYIYDGEHIALVFDGLDNNELTNRYLHGPAVDQILADEQLVNGLFDQILWPLTDHLGSVRDLADSSGEIANHLVYDSFGNILSETNSNIEHLFAYTGRERDYESDLYYYRARYYDPFTGRFVSEDPIGFTAGDVNIYRYVGNSSTIYVDPSGMVVSHSPVESDDDYPETKEEFNFAIEKGEKLLSRSTQQLSDAFMTLYNLHQAGKKKYGKAWERHWGCGDDKEAMKKAVNNFYRLLAAERKAAMELRDLKREYFTNHVATDSQRRRLSRGGLKLPAEHQVQSTLYEELLELGGQTAAEAGLSMIPGVGEVLDIGVLLDPEAPQSAKALAAASLALSAVTLGTAVNYGAFDNLAKLAPDEIPSGGRNPAPITLRPARTLNFPKNKTQMNRPHPDWGHTWQDHGGQRGTGWHRSRAASQAGNKPDGTPKWRDAKADPQQGFWTDNQQAAGHIEQQSLNVGYNEICIPEGMGNVVFPDGTVKNATTARVIVNADGTINTAYPVVFK
ncbi:Hypothetical protein PBC10988_2370 [Planctomycetales bacterium 10988]|nr:Hypothetical protein PBC10988_2370 [Planctomycetales bacterium 10988]